MPLLHKKLSVIVLWLTFTQLQLIRWLLDWLVAALLTDLLTSLLTSLLTNNWLADWFNYWPAGWLTDWLWLIGFLTNWLAHWLIDLTGWLTYWDPCKALILMPSWCESRLLWFLSLKMTVFSFQIRFVQQMCQDFNSQDFELIFCTVSAV